jgi:Ca2+-binding EF-hand superfamily protein
MPEVERIKKWFDTFDKEGDGQLNLQELKEAVSSLKE